MPGRQGRDGRKAYIPDTVIRIASGSTKHTSNLALRHTIQTVFLLSALPTIDYAHWRVTIEVHVPEPLVAVYTAALAHLPCTVLGRPEFEKRGAMRKYLEELGNPGNIVMCDDDFIGLDRFPSTNGVPVVQDPKGIAGLLRTAFADMTKPSALGKTGGFDYREALPPFMWGFRVRECEDRLKCQGSSGPRFALPWLGKRQPLLQNFVVIRKGAPGGYPERLDNCEDAWRQNSCQKIAGEGSIGTHLIAKIDFDRKGTNARNKKNAAYQHDRQQFESAFPTHKTLQERSSWTKEQRKKYEPTLQSELSD
jgi:hypothetical protein